MNGNLGVLGNATIINDLDVSGNATITNDLGVSGNATITNDLSVSGNATITNDLGVSGNATITNDLGVSGNATITNDLGVSGNATITNDLSVSGNLTVSGTTTQLNTDVYTTEKLEIEYDGIDTALLVSQNNSIGDIITASNIDSKVFSITSDGKISVGNIIPAVSLDLSYNDDALKLPKGNDYTRNAINATSENDQGLIRYNTESKQFEGFGAGNAWGSLGGVIDVDQDTKILAETSANADNDELQFITAGYQHMIIKQDGKIGINTSLPAFSMDLNTVDGIKIPAGTEGEKPSNLVTSNYGLIRFNTTSGQFEGFGAGGAWGSLGGVIDVDQDTKILAETSANADNDELQFYTKGSINMVIKSNGFVGIGTESPSSILDIYSHNSNIFNVSDNEITTYKNIIPNSTNSIDLGSVDYKFREVFSGNIYSSGDIYANNNIGIQTTSPAKSLHVVGEIIATNKITSYYSDERLKTNIENIKEPLELIKNLNGFYYTPNELAESFGIKSSNREVGLSAQEVNKILPELTDLAPFDMCLDNDGNIKSKSGNNYLTISYERMVPVIIESLKELTQEVEALKKENKILKEKIMRV